MVVVKVAVEPAGSSWHVLVGGWRRGAASMKVAGVGVAGSSEQMVQGLKEAGKGGCQWEAMEAAGLAPEVEVPGIEAAGRCKQTGCGWRQRE